MLGPSGSGKSTLLRVDRRVVAPRCRHGVARRRRHHPPADAPAQHRHGVPGRAAVPPPRCRREHRLRAANAQMAGVGDRRPRRRVARPRRPRRLRPQRVDRLSGGEKKRVALARSLAPRPRCLLLDEPLTGLDRELHDRLIAELAEVLRATATTAVLVTHDRDEAARSVVSGSIGSWSGASILSWRPDRCRNRSRAHLHRDFSRCGRSGSGEEIDGRACSEPSRRTFGSCRSCSCCRRR